MKKTLSLLLALVMVISLFPGFADEKATLTAEEAGAVLQGYGAIKGGSDGNLMIDKELKRQDAVVILTRLMGKEADALATQAAPSFEDITIDYYKPFLAFAEANKWVEGKAEKKFGFNDVVTVKEFTAMLLRALGHDTMGDNYAKVMDLAKEQGLFQGVMAEEAAPVIRGVAFIMMNNTLETAPKGEKQALVYKLGYKEEPKPENLTVVSAEAAGLKAIDVKFSKAVDGESFAKMFVKDGNKTITVSDKFLLDEMTARLVLTKEAVQDSKYTVLVSEVKAVDGKEVVEKFETSIYMTDATRPEVMSVEALNPKTLLVKTSEPVKNAYSAVKRLEEVKIDGKALYGKIVNKAKNEVIVELNSALKPGDYKVEISRLTDYAGFVAKTMEFDITVVEDKDAPMVTDAKMISVDQVKIFFNEGIYNTGIIKVNGEDVKSVVKFNKGDKEVLVQLKKHLDIGAVVEVKVEYKGQKDIMGNTVKDLTKFTFKVEDDATLPEVKEVTVNNATVKIEFTKNMLKKSPATTMTYAPVYTLMKDGKVVVKNQPIVEADWNDEGNVLKLTIASLKDQNTSEYTLVLEGLKDSTVRMNAMPKTEVAVSGKDTKQPTVTKTYKLEHAALNDDAYLMATIYFSEEMDEETLLDKKNFTFSEYTVKAKNNGVVRADSAAVTLSVADGGKSLIIEANDLDVAKLGKISMVGLKDKAGNALEYTSGTVVEVDAHDTTPGNETQRIKSVELVEGDDDHDMLVKVVVNDEIPSFSTDSGVVGLKVNSDGAEKTKLTLVKNEDNFTFYFKIDTKDVVGTDAKAGADALEIAVLAGEKAKSILGDKLVEDAGDVAEEDLVDKVAPRIDKKAAGTVDGISYVAKVFTINFTESLKGATNQVVRLKNSEGKFVPGAVNVVGKKITFTADEDQKNGNYTFELEKIVDNSDNVAALGNVSYKLDAPTATLKDVTVTAPGTDIQINLVDAGTTAAYGKKADGTAYTLADVKGDFEITHDGNTTSHKVTGIAFAAGKITLTLNIATVNGKEVKVNFVSGKLVDSVNTDVIVPAKVITFTAN